MDGQQDVCLGCMSTLARAAPPPGLAAPPADAVCARGQWLGNRASHLRLCTPLPLALHFGVPRLPVHVAFAHVSSLVPDSQEYGLASCDKREPRR